MAELEKMHVLQKRLPYTHDQEKCVLLYEALSLGPVNWAELRENLSEQLALHEKGDLVHHVKVLPGAPVHVKVDQALEA